MAYLSIIIPVYNAETYLEACMDSILNQSFKDYEIILVDDGSTDRSGNICDTYVIKDRRVKVIHIENGGPAKARNCALTIAKGKYVEFVDSDDRIEPDTLVKIYEKMFSLEQEVVNMSANVADSNDHVVQVLTTPSIGKNTVDDILNNLTPKSKEIYLHYLWNKWYNLKFLKDHNILFDEDIRLGEDFMFNCDVFKAANTVEEIDVSLYRYYKRDNGSLSSKYNADEIQRRRLMDSMLVDLFRYRKLYSETIQKHIDEMIGAMALASLRAVLGKNTPDKKAQIAYIQEFLESEYYDYIIKYSHSEAAGLANKIELQFLKKYCIQGFLFVEKIRKMF